MHNRVTRCLYRTQSDEEEPDELQEAKKNTMMNEDIEEKHKSKDEPKVRNLIRHDRGKNKVM